MKVLLVLVGAQRMWVAYEAGKKLNPKGKGKKKEPRKETKKEKALSLPNSFWEKDNFLFVSSVIPWIVYYIVRYLVNVWHLLCSAGNRLIYFEILYFIQFYDLTRNILKIVSFHEHLRCTRNCIKFFIHVIWFYFKNNSTRVNVIFHFVFEEPEDRKD